MAKTGQRRVVIRLIGGEPFLAKTEVLYLIKRVRDSGLRAEFSIDTNGRVPMQWFLDEGFPCDLTVCLSSPEDHNRLRYSAGHDSASAIFNQISNLRLREEQHITLRYNVHDENMVEFSRFLDWIAPLKCNPVPRVVTALIDNYAFNEEKFMNRLTYIDYCRWYSETAIPELIKFGWQVSFRRLSRPVLCQGRQLYSCKVYAGGQVTICDAMQVHYAAVTIQAMADDVELLNAVYGDVKHQDPWKNPGCQKCESLPVCFGRKWCQSRACQPSVLDHIVDSNRAIINSKIKDLS